MTKEELEELILSKTIKEIAYLKKITIFTVYRYLRKYEMSIPKNKVLSKEELSHLYLDLKYSSRKIAGMLDYSHQSILNWIEEYGITKNNVGTRPKHKLTKEDLEAYLKEYNTPYSISKVTGLSFATIKKLMLEYDLDKVRLDKDFLKKEIETKSIKQIALENKVTPQTIYVYLNKFNLR